MIPSVERGEIDWGRLVDRRLGIVHELEPLTLHPHLPNQLHAYRARVADTAYFSLPMGSAQPGGCAWWSADAARWAAAGEAIERYCGHLLPNNLLRASFAELYERGEPALDPAALALYAEWQYDADGFPFVRFARQLRVLWTEGIDLATRQRVLVPASLVYLNYFLGPAAGEPPTHLPMNAGIAAGHSREAAEQAALEELIERDSLATAWLRGESLPHVSLPDWLESLLVGPAGVLEASLYLFPNAFDLTVLGAFLRDPRTGIVAMGSACRANPLAAAMKAFAEAALSYVAARHLDAPDSPALQQVSPLKGWRADRGYRPLYRPDWRDVTDVSCHVQLYLDPEMQTLLAERLVGGETISFADLPSMAGASHDRYVDLLRQQGLQAISVDLTTPDVATCGLSVVRVVVPGLRCTAPAAFPFLGGLWPQGNGTPAPSEGDVCYLPLPHA